MAISGFLSNRLAISQYGVIVNYNTTSPSREAGGKRRAGDMKNRFIRLTSGWIPVSVLLMLATALVYGGTVADSTDFQEKHGSYGGFPMTIDAAVPDPSALFELQISPLYE